MRLADFIQEHHKQIVKEWVEFAQGLHPWSDGMSEKVLTDHAVELLDAVVSDMQAPQTGSQKADKSKGKGPGGDLTAVGSKHASDRLETGFRLDQLVSEYRALRASVVRLWSEAHGDKLGDLTRFNEAIDETLAEASHSYSELMTHTREQFLAVLGHDLRNPLAAITAGAALLTRSDRLDDKQARVATRILNSAARMARMVNSLLDLARTRLGSTIPITRKPMNLTTVCQQVIAELEVVYPDHALRFHGEGDLSGEWDEDRLTQVVSNLVANALQYGESAVDVRARERGKEVELQVHNDGKPIPEGGLKRIFEPMVRQVESDGDRNATGLGLGLYIAREVTTAHGGTLGVTSTAAEGTTFTLQLPRKPAAAKKQRLAD